MHFISKESRELQAHVGQSININSCSMSKKIILSHLMFLCGVDWPLKKAYIGSLPKMLYKVYILCNT